MSRGVVMIAHGRRAEAVAVTCRGAVNRLSPDLPVVMMGGPLDEDPARGARAVKVSLLGLSPFTDTMYLDADTLPREDPCVGFWMLEDGWDLVIAPSDHQHEDWLWHVSPSEREETRENIGHEALVLQGGVWFVRKNERTQRLFDLWGREWRKHCGQDQGALLRALYQAPVRVWLLGRPWNGGAVIEHRFGMARA